MNYTSEFRKFVTSQYITSAVRVTLAVVIPSLILVHFGVLMNYYLFPLGTLFVGLTDQPGPYLRRRNTLISAVFIFFIVAGIATLVQGIEPLIFLEIIVFGMFFTMIGVYGQRLTVLGSLSLIVLGIFIDGHLTGTHVMRNLLSFLAGSIWFVIVFMIVSTIQPYKLAGQMIGENYLELAHFLKIKAKFYLKNPDFTDLNSQVFAQQISIKNLQENTRETVFRTRKIVNESTTTSRILMLMFLNAVDLHEKLMTSESDYRKIQNNFADSGILENIHNYLNLIADEISEIGIALQSGTKVKSEVNLKEALNRLYHQYFELRNQKLNSENLEDFLVLRHILLRIAELTNDVNNIFRIESQNPKLAKSLSSGLDYQKFLSSEEKLNFKVLRNNFSLKSSLFRHSIRITIALLLGYLISKLKFLGLGHSYWILLAITAILKPAFSITKSRNTLRLFGTISGAAIAYILLHFVDSNAILFSLMLACMILCFSFLKSKYYWAVLFMTVYVFLMYHFLKPGDVDLLFKDRVLDTAIAAGISFLVAYFIFPIWEHTQNLDLMKKCGNGIVDYFEITINRVFIQNSGIEQYKLSRKEAIINLANLSDNFQRMISDPKGQQKKLEAVHQYVATSHLLIAYTASLSQYTKEGELYPEIDFERWKTKISSELQQTLEILENNSANENLKNSHKIVPDDRVDSLLLKRKSELDNNEFLDQREPEKITRLTILKNIREVLGLIYDVAREQRKAVENYYKTNPQP